MKFELQNQKTIDVVGIGTPLLDFIIQVDDIFLQKNKIQKHISTLIDNELSRNIFAQLDTKSLKSQCCSGGSCANTIYGIAKLGGTSYFIGVLGDDLHGDTYEQLFKIKNLDASFQRTKESTGHTFTFITPDGSRTFLVNNAASQCMKLENINEEIIMKSKLLHIACYWFFQFNTEAMMQALLFAKKHNVKISMDLSDYQWVIENRSSLYKLIEDYADIVFANENEAQALIDKEDPKEFLQQISELGKIACLKCGENGSFIKTLKEEYFIPALPVKTVDSTGAGDAYQAGFLLALAQSENLQIAGKSASKYAATIVQQIGAKEL